MQKTYVCNMKIISVENDFFEIDIYFENLKTEISFSLNTKTLVFREDNELSEILKKNEYQLRKILHNKRKETFFTGFELNFVLRDNDTIIEFNDKSKIVVLDKTNKEQKSYVTDFYETNSYILFTDGSYSEKHKRAAYVALIKNPKGIYGIKFGLVNEQNSSLIELIAAIEGLKELKKIEKIRIVTDSRYVIKGLTEWIHNWKLNDWHTAQGTKVKNIEYWKEFEEVTNGKFIEFMWVKGHSFHYENTICDKYAKELVRRKGN